MLYFNSEFFLKLLLILGSIALTPGVVLFLRKCIYARIHKKRLKYKIALMKSFKRTGRIYGLLITLVTLLLAVYGTSFYNGKNNKSTDTLKYADNSDIYEQDELKNILDQHKIELSKLKKEIYCDLTPEERLETYQILLNCVVSWLGCEEECKLATEVLPYYELGYYKDSIHTVVISDSVLMSNDLSQGVSTVLHEAFHFYQNQTINKINDCENENMVSYEVEQWRREILEDYVEYDSHNPDTYEKYSFQYVETSARCFDNQWCSYIVDYICNIKIDE